MVDISWYIDIVTNWFINQLITIDISPITIDISPINHSYYGVYKPTYKQSLGGTVARPPWPEPARCRPRCRRIFGIRHDGSNMYCKTKVLNIKWLLYVKDDMLYILNHQPVINIICCQELLELYSPMVLEYAYQHLPLSKITQSCTMWGPR